MTQRQHRTRMAMRDIAITTIAVAIWIGLFLAILGWSLPGRAA
jgi:hypothetical protein